jgi:hypothetical protein
LIHALIADGFEVVLQDSDDKPSIFQHPALIYVNGFLAPREFIALIQTCDLVIIPNQPRFFSHRISGVTLDALGAAVPVAVPDNTHMSRLVRRFNAGVVYDERSPQSICHAVKRAKLNFPRHTEGALQAATWLGQTGGYDKLAKALMGS